MTNPEDDAVPIVEATDLLGFGDLQERQVVLEAERVIDELEHSFSGEAARRQVETAVDWGRYAELFTYDDSSRDLSLDEEHRPER